MALHKSTGDGISRQMTPQYVTVQPVIWITLHRLLPPYTQPGSFQTPPEMDRNKIIYGYKYKPTYKGPHIWHDHTNHLTRLASGAINNETMLLIFATIIAPLMLCMVAGLGIAATWGYEHISVKMSGHGKRDGEGGKDNAPRQDHRDTKAMPPHRNLHPSPTKGQHSHLPPLRNHAPAPKPLSSHLGQHTP